MTTELKTGRLLLRPLLMADAEAIETLVFADAEVAKWLAHDVSVPGNAKRFADGWCRHLGLDGDNDIWSRGGYGAFVITDRFGEFARPGTILGIVGFYGADKIDGWWCGELFYALGTAYHGRGIMSEACESVMQAWRALPEAGDLYAVYWHTLNHLSGRILRKLGFVEDGPCSLLEEYGHRDALSFLRFELWRIEMASDTEFERVAREAATRIGHLAYEHVVSPSTALDGIRRRIQHRPQLSAVRKPTEAAFHLGLQGEGLLHLHYRRDAWAQHHPVAA